MHPMSGIKYFQSHVREERLCNRNITRIQITRTLAFDEQGRAKPLRRFRSDRWRWSVREITYGRDGVGEEGKRDAEGQVRV